jgi:D-glycero-alpha-D-manno-heptose-7-phosphate kinase
MEIQHNADLPAMCGLGSSSTFTVGLLHCLYALRGKIVTKRQLALDAIHVEQKLIGENVGSQDQTCAAFGGFNKIVFGGSQEICVQPITLQEDRLADLHDHLMLFFTGFQRQASDIAAEQIKNFEHKRDDLATMMQLVDEAIRVLNGGNLADFGRLLHESWMIKKGISDAVSNEGLDSIYEAGRRAGALGGKLLGAGGGGFFLFFVRPELHSRVKEALKDYLYVPFRFESLGSQIIYYAPENGYEGR